MHDLTATLKLADRRKDEFLAMLAHELRNPLAPISTGAAILKLKLAAQPQLLGIVDIIANQTKHITKLVNDLLDVSRVTRGLVSLNKAVRRVVSFAVEQISPFIETHGHHLTLSLPDEPVVVFGD